MGITEDWGNLNLLHSPQFHASLHDFLLEILENLIKV